MKELNKIAARYTKTTFIPDLIGAIVLAIGFKKNNFWNILLLAKIFDLVKLYQRISNFIELKGEYQNALHFLKLLIYIIIIAHFMAILWYALLAWEIAAGFTNTWLHTLNYVDRTWQEKYMACYYWAGSTIFTFGATP